MRSLSLAGALSLLATGCISANRYGGARTLAEGESQHIASVEGVAAEGIFHEHTDNAEIVLAPIPFFSYSYRVGLGERTEAGLGLGTYFGASADLKVQLVRTAPFDLAVAPTLGIGAIPADEGPVLPFATLPLLAGINLGRRATLLGHFMPIAATNGDEPAFFGMAGGSLYVRATDAVAFAPSFATAFMFGESEPLYLFGLALHFGDQADYGPVAGATP